MTKYAKVLEIATIKLDNGDEAKAEKLIINSTGNTEIRFSWWTQEGKQFQHAPLDMSESEWLDLFKEAIKNNVFSGDFVGSLLNILQN